MNCVWANMTRGLHLKGQHHILATLQHNAPRIMTSMLFSTSGKCVHQSSEKEFQLRHQNQPGKTNNRGWVAYRMASVGLLGGLAACCALPGNPLVDFATVTLLVHHNHFGMKSVIADYAPLFFKDWIVNIMMLVWLCVSIVTLGLLYAYNYTNIGFSKAMVKFFKL